MSRVGNLETITQVVGECSFGALAFVVKLDGQRPYLQIAADIRDAVTGQPKAWTGRKWFLSYHMTHSELVQTVFKAVMTFVEHEAREMFTFQGVAVFDPHYDIYKLVELRRLSAALDQRTVEKTEERRAA